MVVISSNKRLAANSGLHQSNAMQLSGLQQYYMAQSSLQEVLLPWNWAIRVRHSSLREIKGI
jgi:hypothetical protein